MSLSAANRELILCKGIADVGLAVNDTVGAGAGGGEGGGGAALTVMVLEALALPVEFEQSRV